MQQTTNYTRVQFIAYHLYTDIPFQTTYASTALDAGMRMRALFDIIEYCAQCSKIDTSPTTLKIFVAPEFYGRSFAGKENGQGHYATFDVLLGFEALKDMCRTDRRFADWFVIPGTFVSAEEVNERTVIFNSVYAFKGDGDISRILHKRFFSSYDKLIRGRRGSGKQIAKSEFFGPKGTVTKPSALIKVGNVKIGIEICRDYFVARLRRSLETATGSSPLKVSDGVDVQVLTACGIYVNDKPFSTIDIDERLAVKEKGHVFRVDGDAGCIFRKTLSVESITFSWGQQPTMQQYVSYKENSLLDEGELPEKLQIDAAPNKPARALNETPYVNKGYFAIYEALDLPRPVQ